MIARRLYDITITDLQELIDNGVGESRTIEYKSELHIEQDDRKREFLADVTSFSNTEGGDLIFGIREDAVSNLPVELVGIPLDSEDELIRRIESLLRDSVSPRIPEIDFHKVPLSDGISILIIRIGVSALSPHRVTYRGHDKFYARNAKGKYPMDVTELRSAFTMSQTLAKEIEHYKANRLSNIGENKYNELLDDRPIFVIQVIPISAFRNNNLYSVKEVSQAVGHSSASAFGMTSKKYVTIDGVKITHKDDFGSEFAHFKTNGIIELATTVFFHPQYEHPNRSPRLVQDLISSADFIERNCRTLDEIKKYYQVLDTSSPIILACAILKGKGFCLPIGFFASRSGSPIDRDHLLFPDVIVDDFSLSSAQILKPMFDSLWNACGFFSCPAYNEVGDFVGLKERDMYF